MRILLDTNVWSRLAERNCGEAFYRYVKDAVVEVVVAPATLLELLRTGDKVRRRQSVRLICRTRWRRLPTDADSETGEIIAEIRRLRPEWMRAKPNLRLLAELRSLWSNQVWRAARVDDPAVVRQAHRNAASESKLILAEQRRLRHQWQDERFLKSLDQVPDRLRTIRVFPVETDERLVEGQGWRPGGKVEMWRADMHALLLGMLFPARPDPATAGASSTYADWLGAHVQLGELRLKEFGEFLLYDVDAAKVGRFWLRSAVNLAQHAGRIGEGNPVDNQHASYLLDADLFVTADKRLARSLQIVRPLSPARFASTAYLHPESSDLTAGIRGLIEAAGQAG